MSFFKRTIEKLPLVIIRFMFNCWPPFCGAGIKVKSIARDYSSFRVSLKLGVLNRNYVGVHFGGSLFSMTDPFFMVILIKHLGNQYIVWDKAARIEFKKAGKGIITADCSFSVNEIQVIRENTDQLGKYIFEKSIDLYNEKNEVIATVIKTMYVKRKPEKAKPAAHSTV